MSRVLYIKLLAAMHLKSFGISLITLCTVFWLCFKFQNLVELTHLRNELSLCIFDIKVKLMQIFDTDKSALNDQCVRFSGIKC